MKIFALDTASRVATIAILEDEKVLLEHTLNDKKTHSENLMPMIEAAFASVDLRPADMDVFGVTIGPGAFTGLRIGISTVKGMAESLGKPVVGLSAVEVLSGSIPPTDRLICPILDAQRDQVYYGLYEYPNTSGEEVLPTAVWETDVIKVQDLIKRLEILKDREADRKILFVGDGVNLHGKVLAEGLKTAFQNCISAPRMPRAAVVGELTRRRHLEGKSYGAEKLKPVYLRKSQAEVQFEERQQALQKKVSTKDASKVSPKEQHNEG